MPKHFIKVKEDFTCSNCQQKVIGTGYTNHCPSCLYSKHVDDLVPGDRASNCQGLMKPISSKLKKHQFTLTHQCQICQKISNCKSSQKDNPKLLTKLSAIPSPYQ